MAVVKVIEIMADSPVSWEDATQRAYKEAAETVNNIQTLYVKDMQAIVDGDKVSKYRVNTKISFVVGD